MGSMKGEKLGVKIIDRKWDLEFGGGEYQMDL